MIWYAWVMVVTLILGAGTTLANVGQPRDPLSGGTALAVCVVNGLMAWAIVSLAS